MQPNPRTGEPPKTNSQGEGLSNEGPSTQTQTDSQRVNGTLVSQNNTLDPGVNTDTQKVRVSGVRRIWGTVKSCSSGAVKNTVSNLVSPEAVPQIGNMVVKRKYKRLPGNKIRWWFLIYMEEDSLEKLESAWMGEGIAANILEVRTMPCTWKFFSGSALATPDLSFDFPPSVEGENSRSGNTDRSHVENQCSKNLRILYFNARSLYPKLDELSAQCDIEKPDVVCLTETWLSEDIMESECAIPGTNV